MEFQTALKIFAYVHKLASSGDLAFKCRCTATAPFFVGNIQK